MEFNWEKIFDKTVFGICIIAVWEFLKKVIEK